VTVTFVMPVWSSIIISYHVIDLKGRIVSKLEQRSLS